MRDCFETLVQEIYTVMNSADLNNRRQQQKGARVIKVHDDPPAKGEEQGCCF